MQANEYLQYLDEDFDFENKVFKANLINGIFKKLKKNINGSEVNIDGVKAALKPLPVMTQDKINLFMDKYIPNYQSLSYYLLYHLL